MWFYDNEPLSLKTLFKKSAMLWRATYRFTWLWGFLNGLLFVISDHFTVEKIESLTPWKNVPLRIDLILVTILFFIPLSFLRSGLMAHMHYVAIGEKNSCKKAIIVSLKKIIPVTISSILYQLFTYLALFLLIFPGIFLGILFFMYLPLIVLDDKPMFKSFVLSAKLIYGNWWQTFFLTAIPLFLIFVTREMMIRYFPNNTIVLAAAAIFLTVMIPYTYAQLLIQYHNLKIKKEIAIVNSLEKNKIKN